MAHNNLEQYDDAENDYKKAIEINSDQLLAWQGLVSFYEKREKWSDLAETLNKLNEIYVASNDGSRLLENINKLADIYRSKEPDDSKASLYMIPFLAYQTPSKQFACSCWKHFTAILLTASTMRYYLNLSK